MGEAVLESNGVRLRDKVHWSVTGWLVWECSKRDCLRLPRPTNVTTLRDTRDSGPLTEQTEDGWWRQLHWGLTSLCVPKDWIEHFRKEWSEFLHGVWVHVTHLPRFNQCLECYGKRVSVTGVFRRQRCKVWKHIRSRRLSRTSPLLPWVL